MTQRPSISHGPASRYRALAMLILLCSSSAFAQPAGSVAHEDVARAKAQMRPLSDEDIEQAHRKYVQPLQQEQRQLDEALRAHRPTAPRLERLPSPAVRPNVDIGAMVHQFRDRLAVDPPISLSSGPRLLVFVTLAMPQESLKALVAQAERSKATLLLRGMHNNSLRQTVTAVRALIGARDVGWAIDPEAFDRYGVRVAPTFVLVRAGAGAERCSAQSCAGDDDYVSISGDVSIDYALETIEQRAPRFKQDARSFLQRIRG